MKTPPTSQLHTSHTAIRNPRTLGRPERLPGSTVMRGVMPTMQPYGCSRYSMRGNAMVSRMCSSPQIQATQRSMPMPKPPCGTVPYLRRSMYQSKASLRQVVLLDALQQQIRIVDALAAADDFAVAFGRQHVHAQRHFRPLRIGLRNRTP